MNRFRSTLIRDVKHEGDTLTVQFNNGQIYRYHKVARSVYDAMMSAPSKGGFFTRWIKKYPKKYKAEVVE